MKGIMKKLKLKRRAIVALSAMHFYGNPSRDLKVIGVTGTNGKTTTTTLLYKIARILGYKAGLIGTVEVLINDNKYEFAHKIPTTPDPLTLNKIFKKMKSEGVEYVFIEVSSHAMDQSRVAGINFTGGIFTNLTHDHLDYHGSIEKYFKAKKKFFDTLPDDAFALTNSDDEHGLLMVSDTRATVRQYGFTGGENFHGEILKSDFSGLEVRFNGANITSELIGKFNAYNLLSVWSACKLLDFDMLKVQNIIPSITAPKGRFESYLAENGVVVIVDYAHSPDAIEKVLLTVKEIKSKEAKVISVYGCGGDRDPLKRRVMGKVGAMLSDVAIFTSDNPRSEDPEKIIREMKTDLSMQELNKVRVCADRRVAISEALALSNTGDFVVVMGKGHENYQEIHGVKHHFNDMEEVKKILK